MGGKEVVGSGRYYLVVVQEEEKSRIPSEAEELDDDKMV